MFEEKTIEEFNALTVEEQAKYLAEKKKHEAKVRKEEIDKAILEANDKNSEEVKALHEELKALKTNVQEYALKMKSMTEKGRKTPAEKTELIKFIEREAKATSGWEQTTVKAAALMTTANVTPNVVDGFNQLFGNYIDPEIYAAPKQDPFIMQLVDTQTAPGTEKIWYVQRVNEEGDAEFIAEGTLKPLVDGEYAESSADIKEVAERWKLTKRLMNHAPTVVTDFRQHADELIRLKMDDGVLNGDGLGNNLSGISTLASPFVVPTQLANYYQDENIYDAIMAVATYVRLNNFKGDLTCVLNTVWKAKMQGIKETTTGAYIMPPFVSPDGTMVGSVRVIFENGMDEDSILLGDLKQFKVRISENVEYAEGYENDDFSKNLVSRKLESFLGTYLPSNAAGAIIYDDIATVLTAIGAIGAI